MLDDKWIHLRTLLKDMGSCVIAYSGGVDSVFLAKSAHDALGHRALSVIADSPSLPRSELEEAVALAKRFGFALKVIKTREFSDERYLSNPLDRCYFCKHALFDALVPIARDGGFKCVVYGENASDTGDHRPGARAATEFEVRAPLKEAGLTKQEIRELSARLGLPTADKPQMACLSSRIPTGEPVTESKLTMIEVAEGYLRDMGFGNVRVRHHQLTMGALARIEVDADDLSRLLESDRHESIAKRFQEIGYIHVTVDLAGYRRGSTNGTNQVIAREPKEQPLTFRDPKDLVLQTSPATQHALPNGPTFPSHDER